MDTMNALLETISTETVSNVQCDLKKKLEQIDVQLIPESLIKRSLIVADLDIGRACDLICGLISKMQRNCEWFTNSSTDRSTLCTIFTSISAKGPNGESVLIARLVKWDESTVDAEHLCSLALFAVYCSSLDADALKSGLIIIYDIRGVNSVTMKNCSSYFSTFSQILSTLPVKTKVIFPYPVYLSNFSPLAKLYCCIRPNLPKSMANVAFTAQQIFKILVKIGPTAILNPTDMDTNSFIECINKNGDQVMSEWSALKKLIQ